MPTPSVGMSPFELPPQWFNRLVPIQPQVWPTVAVAPTALALSQVAVVVLPAAPGTQLPVPLVPLVFHPWSWLRRQRPLCLVTGAVPLTLTDLTLRIPLALPILRRLQCLLHAVTVLAVMAVVMVAAVVVVVAVVVVAAVVVPLGVPAPHAPETPIVPAVPAGMPHRSSFPPWTLVPWGTS